MQSRPSAKMLRARRSLSYYHSLLHCPTLHTSPITVPLYNYTGTHITYIHWNTSGNAQGMWWDSSGTHPFSRGTNSYSLHATGILGEAVRPGRTKAKGGNTHER